MLLPNQKDVQNVGNYGKIYFPSRVNHPEKQKIITDSSNVNVRYLSIDELQSKLEMAQKNPTESVRRLSYLSMKASKISNREGIQVSKDHDIELKEIIDNNDNPFNEETSMSLLWQQQKQQAKGKSKGRRKHPLMIQWCLSIYHTYTAACKHISTINVWYFHM